jgi:signal transduction histidine kinase
VLVEKARDSRQIDDAAVADHAEAVTRRDAGPPSEVLQNAMLTSGKLSVMTTDADGIIQFFNAGAERLLGYSAAEVVNTHTPVDFHAPEQLLLRAGAVSGELSTVIAPDFAALTCKASLGIEDCYESTWIRKNRERMPVAVAITGVRDDLGRVIGYSLLVTDNSAHRPSGFEPGDLSSPGQQATVCRSDLLTRMSHEMRTPLSVILGFAQLMESARATLTASQRNSISRILQAGWYMEKLIGLTRDLALVESGNLCLSIESVSLAPVMLEWRTMVELQAQTRGVRVTFPVLEIPCCVSADRNRLLEVLGHLLSAAIEYSEVQGAIVVDCELHDAEWIRIHVRDGGAGTFAARPTRPESMAEGTAIGLRLAQRLVELMGGAIGVERIDGGRNLFSLDLKRMPVSMEAGHTLSGGGRQQNTVHLSDHHARQH